LAVVKGQPKDLADPRVIRTRSVVVDHVRALLAESGSTELTFTTVAERTGISRQTLYNHWPSIDRMIVDVVRADGDRSRGSASKGSAAPTRDAQEAISAYLARLRDDIADPARAGALLALMVQARHDERSQQALAEVIAERWGSFKLLLDGLLDGAVAPVDGELYARFAGPVFFRVFFDAATVDDEFIAAHTAAMLASFAGKAAARIGVKGTWTTSADGAC
jgi:AcrR family transcriptional regulator